MGRPEQLEQQEMPVQLGQPEEPARIDYLFFKDVFAFGKDIFEKETELSIKDSSVIFNTEPWVSDHSGVLTKIGIP